MGVSGMSTGKLEEVLEAVDENLCECMDSVLMVLSNHVDLTPL